MTPPPAAGRAAAGWHGHCETPRVMERHHRILRALAALLLAGSLLLAAAPAAWSQTAPAGTAALDSTAAGPRISLTLGGAARGRLDVALEIVLLMTVLSLAPALLVLLTSFTRIVIVFGFLRQALGTHTMPSNQILVGLALFLTVVVMSPVAQRINDEALQPYLREELTPELALEKASVPLKQFMLSQVREKDVALMLDLTHREAPDAPQDLPLLVVVPSFILGELKMAFQMGFVLFLPFLVIDMVVASVLMSMGMMMLPPVLISLPFKVLLFVLVDGWYLIVQSLVASFHV